MKHTIIKANTPQISGDIYTEEALKDSMNHKKVPILLNNDMSKPPIGFCETSYNKKAKELVGKICLSGENKRQNFLIDLLESKKFSIGCSYVVHKKTNKTIEKLELLSTSIVPKWEGK